MRVDALELSDAMLPIPVDPDARRSVAEVDGRPTFDRTVELAEASSESVDVRLEVATPHEAARTIESPVPTPEPSPPPSDVTGESWFWTIVVAGLAAGAVVIGLELDVGRFYGATSAESSSTERAGTLRSRREPSSSRAA